MSLRPIIIVVSLLFIGFIVLQWMSMKSQRLPRRRGNRARRRRRAQVIAPKTRKGPSPWAMIAGLVMTLVALGLALFWRSN